MNRALNAHRMRQHVNGFRRACDKKCTNPWQTRSKWILSRIKVYSMIHFVFASFYFKNLMSVFLCSIHCPLGICVVARFLVVCLLDLMVFEKKTKYTSTKYRIDFWTHSKMIQQACIMRTEIKNAGVISENLISA